MIIVNNISRTSHIHSNKSNSSNNHDNNDIFVINMIDDNYKVRVLQLESGPRKGTNDLLYCKTLKGTIAYML